MRIPLNLVVLALYLVNCLSNFDAASGKSDVEVMTKRFALGMVVELRVLGELQGAM